MFNLSKFNKAVESLKLATQYKKDTDKSNQTRQAIPSEVIKSLSEGLTYIRQGLESKITNYLSKHPALKDNTPGLSDIFGLLSLEEEYSRCLAWLLQRRDENNFGPLLLCKILEQLYNNIGENIKNAILFHEYNVEPERWIESGRLDVLITSTTPNLFLIVIENKILAGTKEGEDVKDEISIPQLQKYAEWTKKQNYKKHFLVFLCADEEQKRSQETKFKVLTWEKLISDAGSLRSNLKGVSLYMAILDLFLRDVERMVSPLAKYRKILQQRMSIEQFSIKELKNIVDQI